MSNNVETCIELSYVIRERQLATVSFVVYSDHELNTIETALARNYLSNCNHVDIVDHALYGLKFSEIR